MAKTAVFQLEGLRGGSRECRQSAYTQAPHSGQTPYSKLTSLRLSQVGVPAEYIQGTQRLEMGAKETKQGRKEWGKFKWK